MKSSEKTKKATEVPSRLSDHPAYAAFVARFPLESDRYKIRVSVPKDLWQPTGLVPPALKDKLEDHKWTAEERDAIARGNMVCPVCEDVGTYKEVFDAVIQVDKEPFTVVHDKIMVCKCRMWKHIWNEAKKEIPKMYHYVHLRTLQPNTLSRLSFEKQQEELEYISKHRNESFLFLGPSGTGKTTFSMAMLRHAYERKSNERHFWRDNDKQGASFNQQRWIWRGNFNTMLQEYNEKNREGFGGEPVDAPDVSVKKIYAAYDAGRRPVLIMEEVDKIDLNSHRVKFLFSILDAMLNTEGQLIMTTNLSLAGLYKTICNADPVSGETIARRLIQAGHVRDYFEHVSN